MRRLIDIHQEEERQLVIRVLLPHLQTGRLRLEHLPAMNQRADLLRTVGEMLGMALCEKTQHSI